MMSFSRREFCAISGSAVASFVAGSACRLTGGSEFANFGRLAARPRDGVKTSGSGEIRLGLDHERDAILQLPQSGSSSSGQSRLPLFVMLHGATQSAEDMFWYLGKTHEEAGVAVLAPNSRGTTWDA